MPGKRIAIDLGTDKIKVYVKGKGIVMSEANAVTYETGSNEVVAMGNSARKMTDKLPDTLEMVFPIKNGIIADFSVMREILSSVIETVCKKEIWKPHIIISCPASCTDLQKKTIIDVACFSGGGKVCVIESPIASALGCARNVEKPWGNLVIDMGAGTTDIAVITMNESAYSRCVPIGGDSMDEAIAQYIKKEKDILIGKQTAEKIRLTCGAIYDCGEEIEMTVSGKDFISSMPVTFTVTSSQIITALSDTLSTLVRELKAVLEETSPELHSDICSDGVILTGGCACLRGLKQGLEKKTGLNVIVAADGENTAVKGAGYALKNIKSLENNGYIFKMKEKDMN